MPMETKGRAIQRGLQARLPDESPRSPLLEKVKEGQHVFGTDA